MEEVILFKEFNVVKILERGAFTVWKKLLVGEEVSLVSGESDWNPIVVKFEDTTFGELPEHESEIIRKFLKQGWINAFKARICKRDEEALYDQRISIAVYIIRCSTSSEVAEESGVSGT